MQADSPGRCIAPKPFTFEQLALRVRDMLDRPT
jgi:hypothetical protein